MHSKIALGLLLSLFAFTAFAQQPLPPNYPPNLQPLPEPPPIPDQLQSGEAMPLGEPQVTIIQREDAIIREYRLNGHLYAIKITPRRGKPYYLIDSDGDGLMESRFVDLDSQKLLVPQWVLFRW